MPFIIEAMRRVLKVPIQSCLQGLADGAVDAMTALKNSAYGAVGGVSWSAGKPEGTSILHHAVGTLLKFPAGNLDKLVADATEAHGRLSDEIARHAHLFGNGKAVWTLDLNEEKKKLMESLKAPTLAASVTNN